MTLGWDTVARLQAPTFAGSVSKLRRRQLGRRRVLQAGVSTVVVGTLGYVGWAGTRDAFAATPNPNGLSHAEAEIGNLFYDYGSQNLMEVASLSDLPELIEFSDRDEGDTAGFALASNNEMMPQAMPLPRVRPDVERLQIAQASAVPMPAIRRDNAIPTRLALPELPSPDSVNINVVGNSQTDLGRAVSQPRGPFATRLGRGRRTLRVHAVNIGERLNISYFRNGRYDTGALAELDNLFRDRHSRKVAEIDAGVYDQLFAISNIFGGKEINMLSGYRAPETNEAMRRRMGGVARFSYHVKARAADFYISRVSISEIHIAVLKLTVGGVGYYPGSNFVHIDTGPLRNWPSRYHSIGRRYRES